MFCPEFGCISEALKNRITFPAILLLPMPQIQSIPALRQGSACFSAHLQLSNTLTTTLAVRISGLFCDLKKPSLVKHSLMSMADLTLAVWLHSHHQVPLISCHLTVFPCPQPLPTTVLRQHQAAGSTP